MPWSTRYITCIIALCALLLLSQPTAGTGFVPRAAAAGEAIARHVCAPAAPDVSESSIIADVCNQTLANDTCSDQLTANMQQSATNTCGLYFGLLTNCLTANNDDHTACSDSLFGFQDCKNYTMQAYAYCACYYTLPESLAECANEQLMPQSQGTATAQATSAPATALATGSDIVPSATSADKRPTPTVLPVNGGAAFPSSQSTVPFSDPRVPKAPTLRTTSLEPALPSSNPGTAWTPNAAPNPSAEPITLVLTYTTTFTVAGYTTTATITPVSISTVYTCADNNGGGVPFPAPTSAASAPIVPTPTVLAPLSSESFAPDPSAVVPAQGTEASTAEGSATERSGSPETSLTTPSAAAPAQSTEASMADGTASKQTGSQEPSVTSPSAVAVPAPSTGVLGGSSEATAGKNESAALCVRCRRRSKIVVRDGYW